MIFVTYQSKGLKISNYKLQNFDFHFLFCNLCFCGVGDFLQYIEEKPAQLCRATEHIL